MCCHPNYCHAQSTGKTARKQIQSNASEQWINYINPLKYSNSSEFCLQDVTQQCPIEVNPYQACLPFPGGQSLNPCWAIALLWLRLKSSGLKYIIVKLHFTDFGQNSIVSCSSSAWYHVWSLWCCSEVKIHISQLERRQCFHPLKNMPAH